MYPSSDQNLSYETDGAVYFMSHAFDPLNPWSAHQVKLWGKIFPTAEHAYHYRKFSDHLPKVARAILKSPSPWAAMQVERKHKPQQRPDWNKVKSGIMAEILRALVSQNQDVRDCLLATGSKTIIKNSPFDPYWGNGQDGKGQNMMGQMYMDIRKELKEGAI
jgi:N-glycosidase YbiA